MTDTRGALPLLVLASGNTHKVQELSRMLHGVCRVISMREAGFTGEPEESGTTFEENARIKAECVSRATGLPCLADDSGLEVDALGGEPGVHSARYAGPQHCDADNNALLQARMANVPSDKRTARFVCCIAFSLPGSPTWVVRGECPGTILREPRGNGGFGYDPYFLYETGVTFAEISTEEKSRVSHRARAMCKALPMLQAWAQAAADAECKGESE